MFGMISKKRAETALDAAMKDAEALCTENTLLKRALGFYSVESNYPEYAAAAESKILDDRGLVARGVLEKVWFDGAVRESRASIRQMLHGLGL